MNHKANLERLLSMLMTCVYLRHLNGQVVAQRQTTADLLERSRTLRARVVLRRSR